MKKINVLVLGVSGNVSQGIIKAIKASKINCNIIGACVIDDSVGFLMCDVAYLSPFANSEDFIPWLIKVCNEETIDIILTGVEENIIAIEKSAQILSKRTKAIFKNTSLENLKIGQDKFLTCQWLEKNNCNYPKYALSNDDNAIKKLIDEMSFPFIAKPLSGKGSKGIFVINNKQELEGIIKKDNYIIQQCIGTKDSEYTVGCYCDKNGVLKDVIIMQRYLHDGTTWKATVVENKEIYKEAEKICKAFKPVGPLNIQLRLDENNKPITFELNVRFSGTTSIRANFGYNDVAAMIKEYVLGENINDCFNIVFGTAYRYIDEIYVIGDVPKNINKNNSINISNHNIYTKNYMEI